MRESPHSNIDLGHDSTGPGWRLETTLIVYRHRSQMPRTLCVWESLLSTAGALIHASLVRGSKIAEGRRGAATTIISGSRCIY